MTGLEPPIKGRVFFRCSCGILQGVAPRCSCSSPRTRRASGCLTHRSPLRPRRRRRGVQLVDEEDHVFGVADLVQHRLDPFFELAAVFGPGQQRTKIERLHAPVFARSLGTLPVTIVLRQALDDRRLSDAGFADQDRIIFRAAARAPGWNGSISSSRPMTGSSLFCRASSVKSRVYFLRAS